MPSEPNLRVICQFISTRDNATVKWSDGGGDFGSYNIERLDLGRLRRKVAEARKELSKLVDVFQYRQDSAKADCLLKLEVQATKFTGFCSVPAQRKFWIGLKRLVKPTRSLV